MAEVKHQGIKANSKKQYFLIIFVSYVLKLYLFPNKEKSYTDHKPKTIKNHEIPTENHIKTTNNQIKLWKSNQKTCGIMKTIY